MKIEEMNIEQLEERKAAILEAIETPDADVDALEEEARSINARMKAIKEAAELKAEEARKVADGEGDIIKEIIKEETRNMDIKEIRNSAEYVDAFAEYVKTGKADECRALITENVGGTIAVPDFVYDYVKTAWDKNEIMNRVNRVAIPGNLKVNFEISGDDALIHEEGEEAIPEERLEEGIATLSPVYFKKWVAISDEVMSLRGEEFLRYIYAEITHKIVKAMADALVYEITSLPAVADSTHPSVPVISTEPSIGAVAQAISMLSDDAENPVIIMNKRTYAAFKAVAYAGNYAVDPFEGLTVLFNNSLDAPQGRDKKYAIVGDLGYGAMANFPNGDAVEFKFDDLSRKKEDLVEVLGKEYAGIGVVACNAFAVLSTPSIG